MTINKLYISSILFLIFILGTSSLAAQVSKDKVANDSILNAITDIDGRIKAASEKHHTKGGLVVNQLDSLADFNTIVSNLDVARRDEKGTIIYHFQPKELDESLTFRDTVIFDPVFLPVVFEGKILPSDMNLMPKDSVFGNPQSFRLIDTDQTFAPALEQSRRVEEMRRSYYTKHLGSVTVNALEFNDNPVIKEAVVEKKSVFKELLSTNDAVVLSTPDVETTKIKKIFWKKSGEHQLHVSHNGMSDNWNGTGGKGSYNINNYHKFDFNYKRDRFTLDNTIEWKLNLVSTQADTLHKVSINDDYLRVYSVAGIKAFNNWSYSMNAEAKTQLFNSFYINSRNRQTAFMSPLIVKIGAGMSYKLEKANPGDKYKNVKLTADISPLSYSYTYVRAYENVKPNRFGIDKEGDHAMVDLGSNVNVNFVYNFNRYASYSNRLSYFTSYKKVKAESENKLNFALNQYFSTSINLYMRFDDAISSDSKDKTWGYFQYNEVVGFGLAYKW